MTAQLKEDRREQWIDKLRQNARLVTARGMGCQVSGVELRSVLGALDEARARIVDLESNGNRRNGQAVDDSAVAHAIIRALDNVLVEHADLWGQPASDAVASWCEKQGRPMPAAWSQLLGKVRQPN